MRVDTHGMGITCARARARAGACVSSGGISSVGAADPFINGLDSNLRTIGPIARHVRVK